MNQDIKNNINAFEMWCLRRMQRISYTTHKSNNDVLQQTIQERKLMKTIIERQLGFFGHAVRKNAYEFLSISGKISGSRSRGRQRRTMSVQLKEFTGLTIGELTHRARERDGWRELTYEASNAWDRQGT